MWIPARTRSVDYYNPSLNNLSPFAETEGWVSQAETLVRVDRESAPEDHRDLMSLTLSPHLKTSPRLAAHSEERGDSAAPRRSRLLQDDFAGNTGEHAVLHG